jgi:hypothetical protein
MTRQNRITWVIVLACCALAAAAVAAGDRDQPIFVRWLTPGNPHDETIAVYWRSAEAGELDAAGYVDLATMLFDKGFPKDAIRMCKRALKLEPEMAEAWFRIGLVEHREGNLRAARKAYHKCLKILTGHGWCNFYLGLLEEQTGDSSKAIYHYRRAFKFAPELADPAVNPEVLYSHLQLAGVIQNSARNRFGQDLPLGFLQPERVAAVRSQFEATPTPEAEATLPASRGTSPTPTPTPIPLRSSAAPPGSLPPGAEAQPPHREVAPRVRSVSAEAGPIAIRPRRPGITPGSPANSGTAPSPTGG